MCSNEIVSPTKTPTPWGENTLVKGPPCQCDPCDSHPISARPFAHFPQMFETSVVEFGGETLVGWNLLSPKLTVGPLPLESLAGPPKRSSSSNHWFSRAKLAVSFRGGYPTWKKTQYKWILFWTWRLACKSTGWADPQHPLAICHLHISCNIHPSTNVTQTATLHIPKHIHSFDFHVRFFQNSVWQLVMNINRYQVGGWIGPTHLKNIIVVKLDRFPKGWKFQNLWNH